MRWQSGARWVSLVLFFVVLLYIFSVTGAFYPWNGDDWAFLAHPRSMVPQWGAWNPSRVLPEVFLPLLGLVAAYVVTPLVGNYIEAVQLTASVTAAFCICCLCAAVGHFLRVIFTRDTHAHALSGMLLFMVLSLYLLKSGKGPNLHLFHSYSLCTFGFYVIPNILNSLLVLGFLAAQMRVFPRCRDTWGTRGGLLLVIYLAQFSLTFGALISTVCAGVLLLVRIASAPGRGLWPKFLSWLRNLKLLDVALIFCVCCFIIAVLVDMSGGRYTQIKHPELNLRGALSTFYHFAGRVQPFFLLLMTGFCGGALCIALRRIRTGNSEERENARNLCFLWAVLGVSCVLFLCLIIVIAAMTFTYLAGEIQSTYGIFFYLLLLTVICATYLLRAIPALWLGIPILLCFLCVEIGRCDRPWIVTVSAKQKAIVNAWIDEAQKADREGRNNITITVGPKTWPHPDWFGQRLSQTLFAHGLTSRRIPIELNREPEGAQGAGETSAASPKGK